MSSVRRVLALLLLLVASGCGPRVEPDPFTIGQLVPLSGPKKRQGEQARNGARLAVEVALHQDRLILGRKVAVRHVDDFGDPEVVGAEAVRLLTLNKVFALLGGPDRTADERLARASQSYGVPVLLPADLSAVPNGESIICLNAAPETRGEILGRFAVRDLHCRHVIALTDDSDVPATALAEAFIKKWRQEQRDQKEAIADAWSWHKETELAERIERVIAAKPDVVLLGVGPESFQRLRMQLAAAGFKAPLLYGGEDGGTDAFTEVRSDGPPVYLATAFTTRADLGDNEQAFVRQYEEEFHEPADLTAALAYDGVRLLINALERAKTTQPAVLNKELLATNDFSGVTGALALADRRAKRRLFVVTVQRGEAKVVGTFGPGAE